MACRRTPCSRKELAHLWWYYIQPDDTIILSRSHFQIIYKWWESWAYNYKKGQFRENSKFKNEITTNYNHDTQYNTIRYTTACVCVNIFNYYYREYIAINLSNNEIELSVLMLGVVRAAAPVGYIFDSCTNGKQQPHQQRYEWQGEWGIGRGTWQ